jgi:hypothetical protein
MQDGGLRIAAPRSGAAHELTRLVERRAALAEQARDIDRRLTFASDDVGRASATLEAVERRRFGGEDVSAEARKAETALAKARAEAVEPWAQRGAGARAALKDADAEIRRFVGENYDSLAGEVEQDARDAAERVDAALGELVAAYREREAIVGRFNVLIGAVGRVEPGMVPFSRCEPVVRAAERVLEAGGEVPPIPKRDPRGPIHGEEAVA